MKTAYTATFGDLLRRYRAAAGLTQEELAEKAGLSAKGIGDLERGARQHPRRDTLRLLADALNLGDRDRAMLEAAARQHRTTSSMAGGEDLVRRQLGSTIPLVGRRDELRLIDEQLSGDAPTVLLLVAGEPGIGKSRLLAEAAPRASDQGWAVLGGGCHRRSGQEPFEPFLDVLARHLARQPEAERRLHLRDCSWLVRLLPELAETVAPPEYAPGMSPEQERRLMFAAVARYLGNVAGPAGTLLVLDDLQWAGQDALDLLAFLLRMAHGDRHVRVLGAYRDTDVHAEDPLPVLLADLAREGLATRATLAPLAADEAAQLLEFLLDDATASASTVAQAAVRERLLERTGGVPYFLVSCVQGLQAGALPGDGAGQQALPWSVAETIHQRVATLTPAAQELLSAAAVAGRSISHSLLITLAQRSGHDARTAIASIESACRARLLTEEGQAGYTFSHDLIREVIASDLSAARRALLHRIIAESLEQSGIRRSAELLAYHYSRAGLPEQAVVYLKQAGDQALAMYANAEAADVYRHLVMSLDELGRADEAVSAREKLGGVLLALARYDEALEVLDSALTTCRAANDMRGAARLTGQIALIHANRGTALDGIARVESLLTRLEHDAPAAALAGMYTLLSELYWASAPGPRLLAVARRGLEYAQAAANPHVQAVAEGRVGNALVLCGDTVEGAETLARVLPVVEAANDLWQVGRISENLALAREAQGNFVQALRGVEHAVALGDRIGDQGARVYIRFRRGMLAFYCGEWERARDNFADGIAIGEEIHGEAVSAFPLFGLGMLDLAMGRHESGTRHLEEALDRSRRFVQLRLLRPASAALAEHDLLERRPLAALARLDPLLEHVEQTEELETTQLLPLLAWARLQLDDVEGAAHIAELAVTRATKEQYRLAVVDAQRVQAMVLARQEHWHAAGAVLEDAIALERGMPYPYAEAKTLYISGQLHTARGETQQAHKQFEAALAILHRLGERLYAEHVERTLAVSRSAHFTSRTSRLRP